MGILNTIRDNLTGGGVKLSLNAPQEFSLNDVALPVELTITSGEQRSIKHIEYRLYKNAKDAGKRRHEAFDEGTVLKPIAQLNIEGPFQVGPSVPLIRRDQLILKVSENLKIKSIDERQYDIWLDAFAQVDGVLINATVHQMIKLRI